MYDRNKHFAELLDSVDSHCFTGDTLHDENNRTLFAEYLGRWERSLKSHEEMAPEIAEAERLEEQAREQEERSEEALAITTEVQNVLNERILGLFNKRLSDAYIEAICFSEFSSKFGIEHIAETIKTLKGRS